jgi:hypothetical protein
MCLLIAFPSASAQPTSDLIFGLARFRGDQSWSGEVLALHLQSDEELSQAQLRGFSPLLQVQATSRNSTAVARGEIIGDTGGFDRSWTNADIVGERARSGMEVLLVPLEGQPLPSIMVSSSSLQTSKAIQSTIHETPHITPSRPLLRSDVSETLQASTTAKFVRVEGVFSVSIWSWNLTVADQSVPTGLMQSNVQRDPIAGTEIAAQNFQQVIQATFNGGWLELDLAEASAVTFVDQIDVRGLGQVDIDQVSGFLADGQSAKEAKLGIEGQYRLTQAWTAGEAYVRFVEVQATSTLDGQPVTLVLGPPDSRPGTVVSNPSDRSAWWIFAPWFVGILLVALVLHGPMQSFRYKRIERYFDGREYIEVLERIDPFTRRRRFSRTANRMKAVSLLSLEQYREAELFLGTLGPLDGPDPATQAFLRACASAGQGHDAEAIEHLTDCFKLDPTYREEAELIPALHGFLPYFDLETGGPA